MHGGKRDEKRLTTFCFIALTPSSPSSCTSRSQVTCPWLESHASSSFHPPTIFFHSCLCFTLSVLNYYFTHPLEILADIVEILADIVSTASRSIQSINSRLSSNAAPIINPLQPKHWSQFPIWRRDDFSRNQVQKALCIPCVECPHVMGLACVFASGDLLIHASNCRSIQLFYFR